MARKSEVYTWRVSPAMKASLEEAARCTNRSVAKLLDEIVADERAKEALRDFKLQRFLRRRIAEAKERVDAAD